MKVIKMMGGSEKVIEDDEAENIMKSVNAAKFLKLRDGSLINVSSISMIDEPEKIALFRGYVMDKGCTSYTNDEGKRMHIEKHHFQEIKYITHPKYDKESVKELREGGDPMIKVFLKK